MYYAYIYNKSKSKNCLYPYDTPQTFLNTPIRDKMDILWITAMSSLYFNFNFNMIKTFNNTKMSEFISLSSTIGNSELVTNNSMSSVNIMYV